MQSSGSYLLSSLPLLSNRSASMQQSEGGNADTNTKMSSLAQVVAAYVSNNHVAVGEIAGLVQTISQALDSALTVAPAAVEVEKKEPAVAIRKSITPDHII